MPTDYPGAIDTTSKLPNPSTSNNTNNPSHAGLHDNTNDAVKATQTKLGVGSSVAASNTLLVGTGTGTSSWSQLTSAQLIAILSDETGSGSAVFANTPVLITPKVDTINENTLNNGVTVGGVNLKAGFMSGANLTVGTVGSSQLATGVPVQVVSTNFNVVATGTTLIPADDTIPQISEGDQYMTQAITPKSATNRLYIEVTLLLSNSTGAQDLAAALFQDSTANALAAYSQTIPTAGYIQNMSVRHDMVAGTSSSTTFRIRAGGNLAGTTTFGGASGARRYGGSTIANFKIVEYKA